MDRPISFHYHFFPSLLYSYGHCIYFTSSTNDYSELPILPNYIATQMQFPKSRTKVRKKQTKQNHHLRHQSVQLLTSCPATLSHYQTLFFSTLAPTAQNELTPTQPNHTPTQSFSQQPIKINPQDLDIRAIEERMNQIYEGVADNFHNNLHRTVMSSTLQLPALAKFLHESYIHNKHISKPPTPPDDDPSLPSLDTYKSRLYHYDENTSFEWLYNKQSGVHPSSIFFMRHPVEKNVTKTHFYNVDTPTKPIRVELNDELFNPTYELNQTRDANFSHKSFRDIVYKESIIEYYKPIPLDDTLHSLRNLKDNTETRYYNREIPKWYQNDGPTDNEKGSTQLTNRIGVWNAFKGLFLSKQSTPTDTPLKYSNTDTKQPHLDTISYPYVKGKSTYTLYPYQNKKQQHDLLLQTQSQILTKDDQLPIAKLSTTSIMFNNTNILTHPRGRLIQASQDNIGSPSKPPYHTKIQFQVTLQTLQQWSKLAGNTNKATLDPTFAKKNGHPTTMVPHHLLATLCLEGLSTVSKYHTTPPKPLIMDAFEEMFRTSLIGGYNMAYLEHVRMEACAHGLPEPDYLTPAQLEHVQREFVQPRIGSMVPPWHAVFQSMNYVAFDSTNPIYFNFSDENYENQTQTGKHDTKEKTLFLNFYAQVYSDDFDHDGYQRVLEERMNDIMDTVDAIQHEANPPTLLDASQIDHLDLQSPMQYQTKQITVAYDIYGKIRAPEPLDVSIIEEKNEYAPKFMKKSRAEHLSAWDISDNLFIRKDDCSIYDVHELDMQNRLYLEDDAILQQTIKLADITRNKPALVKFWLAVDNDNITTKNQIDDINSVFMGYAVFDAPLQKNRWNLLDEIETNNLFNYVQGIEVLQDVIVRKNASNIENDAYQNQLSLSSKPPAQSSVVSQLSTLNNGHEKRVSSIEYGYDNDSYDDDDYSRDYDSEFDSEFDESIQSDDNNVVEFSDRFIGNQPNSPKIAKKSIDEQIDEDNVDDFFASDDAQDENNSDLK